MPIGGPRWWCGRPVTWRWRNGTHRCRARARCSSGRTWSACAAPTWKSSPAQIDPAYTRYPLALGHEWSGIVVSADGRAGAGRPGGRRGHRARAGTAPAARAGDTNLCDTYDELGFTRDGAAAGYLAPCRPRWCTPSRPVSAPRTPCWSSPPRWSTARWPGSAVAPGCRALVIGDGTVALLAVPLLGLWSPGEIVMLGQPGRPGRAGRRGRRGQVRDLAAGGGHRLRPGDRGGGQHRRGARPRWRRPGAAAPCC